MTTDDYDQLFARLVNGRYAEVGKRGTTVSGGDSASLARDSRKPATVVGSRPTSASRCAAAHRKWTTGSVARYHFTLRNRYGTSWMRESKKRNGG